VLKKKLAFSEESTGKMKPIIVLQAEKVCMAAIAFKSFRQPFIA